MGEEADDQDDMDNEMVQQMDGQEGMVDDEDEEAMDDEGGMD